MIKYWAQIDDNYVVTQLSVSESDDFGGQWLASVVGGTWLEYADNGSLRKNPAFIGGTYDPDRDAFIPPKPFESWVLDEATCLWTAPVPKPDDGQLYVWDETAGEWVVSE